MADLQIAEIRRGAREVIRISRGVRHGHAVTMLRVWFRKDGEWRPSPEGVTIPADAVEPVMAALQNTRLKLTGGGSL